AGSGGIRRALLFLRPLRLAEHFGQIPHANPRNTLDRLKKRSSLPINRPGTRAARAMQRVPGTVRSSLTDRTSTLPGGRASFVPAETDRTALAKSTHPGGAGRDTGPERCGPEPNPTRKLTMLGHCIRVRGIGGTLLGVAWLSCGCPATGTVVYFDDPGLEAAIRQELGH